MAEFLSGFFDIEHPAYLCALSVSHFLPGVDLADQRLAVRDTPSQAQAHQDANFNLHHVQPTRTHGGVVELQSLSLRKS